MDVRRRPHAPGASLGAAALAWAALSACQGSSVRLSPEALAVLSAPAPGAALVESQHRGPRVVAGESGTARFARELCESFDSARASELVAFIDGFYRAPANDGFQAVLERLKVDLAQAGFGQDPRLELFEIETPLDAPAWGKDGRHPAQAWTPLAGRIELCGKGREALVLHAFDGPGDVDRVMLPVNVPSFEAEGPLALSLEEVQEGAILVTQALPGRAVLSRAQAAGAAAVVSSYLEPYNVDPTGKERHLDAIQFRSLPTGATIPLVMISPRSHAALRQAAAGEGETRLAVRASVRFDARPLRTLAAVVRGKDRPDEAVAIASHVQEPGACDNATGVAGLAESARGLAKLLKEGRLEWPSRSLVFLWGDEFRQSSAWLASTKLEPVAGLSSDMTGESREKTGAIALLERMPDPAALVFLPPDEHTPWGKKDVPADSLLPNGLAVVARCALVDVGAVEGNWETAEHPYEGGSDHDVFIGRRLPAALFWHFTDFAYHTSLDRLEHVDPTEMRRTAAAILATALAIADPRPADLDRYLRTLNQELDLRVAAAKKAGDPELAERWRQWCHGAREWLRVECLRIPPDQR